MKKKKTTFDPVETITRAQTEIICALLRLLPWTETAVPIRRMHTYLNTDSMLADGFLIESVRLVDYGHNIEMTYREINYETTVWPIDGSDKHLFKEMPRTRILKPDSSDRDLLPMLAEIYTEAEKRLENE